ncbi:MAG: UDP-N-acetylmuramoyl-tripeptide--D-alanyl-D-alanine ligase [Burkholderiaceae bacterium]|nr:UDP-N-acetylmuramoyl-tripeptide--D-alanyl-D-alanine ligase [Burkholderiaceae bacterium]
MTLAQAQALLPGSRLVGDGATPILRVHSDTRTLQPGDLFVALKGERFDAHDFLPQARAAGAVAAIAQHGLDAAGLPGLEVADTLVALQQLARGWRQAHPLPLIAVTGSNGKTTVTQMLASILRAWVGAGHTLATAGNLNNHIGLPLSALRQRPVHRAGVLELGMNHPGEIALLAQIAQPTVVLVNNAQREHQEFMATVEAVARENGSAIAALPPQGVAVFPADDAQAPVWQALAAGRPQLTFALDGLADVHGGGQWVTDERDAEWGGAWRLTMHTPAGPATATLHAAGRHNLKNALAASAAALAAGAPLQAVVDGLQAFRPVAGRSQARRLKLGAATVTLVDDSYNANPDSVQAAIQLLATLPGPHWLLLGDMGEVGDQGPAFHAEVGAAARAAGIAHFWAVGTACGHAAAAYGPGARRFDDAQSVVAALDDKNPGLPDCGAVLVKGSRFMRMEQVVKALQARADKNSPGGAACC